MKKLLVGILSAVMLLALAGCGGGDTKKAAAPEKKAAPAQKIVIGLDDNFAPMGFRDKDNKIVGLDIDLAREACKRANLNPEFKPIDWGAKEAEIKSKRIDCIWNCFTVNPERQKTYGLSKPYLNNAQMYVIRKGDKKITGEADLKGKIVGVQDDSTGDYIFNQKNKALGATLKKLNKYPDFPAAYMDLDNKRIDCLVVDAVLAYDTNKKNPGKYEVMDKPLADEVVAVAFRPDDKELIGKIDKALDSMKQDGTAKKICEKWLGKDMIKYDKK